MSATSKKSKRVAPCLTCRHRYGRHNGGIGACSEPGCGCGSFMTEGHRRRRAAAQASPAAPKPRPLTDEERQFVTFMRFARLFGSGERSRTEPPSTTVVRTGFGDAFQALGLDAPATAQDVVRAFRRLAKETHPDLGGDAGAFKALVLARDVALAELGGG